MPVECRDSAFAHSTESACQRVRHGQDPERHADDARGHRRGQQEDLSAIGPPATEEECGSLAAGPPAERAVAEKTVDERRLANARRTEQAIGLAGSHELANLIDARARHVVATTRRCAVFS